MSIRELREAVEAGTLKPTDLVILGPAEHAHAWGAYKSGSLDAAKRLHDVLLPGWEWHLGPSNAKIYPYNGSPLRSWSGMADNAARAWLLAILRALEKEGRDG